MIKEVNINDLKINPINPRKISSDRLKTLQRSIMLFPKMLMEAKLIIVDEDNIALSGNQRIKVLKEEILAKDTFFWKVVLQEDERYQSMSESEREQVIDFWVKWVENPVINVDIQEGLSEDQKKELIVKENKEYGEFDYDKAELLFDEVSLVGFGVDAGVFYDPDNDSSVIVKVKGSKGKKIDMMSFGKYSVPVTREEYEKLLASYDSYVDTAGVDFGYIRELIKNLK